MEVVCVIWRRLHVIVWRKKDVFFRALSLESLIISTQLNQRRNWTELVYRESNCTHWRLILPVNLSAESVLIYWEIIIG